MEIIIEFILIVILQFIGIVLHALQKITQLDAKYPEMTNAEIKKIYLENDIWPLAISAVVLCLNVVTHFIIHVYAPELIQTIPYFLIWSFIVAFVLGYGGQRIVYKFLGKAESLINKRIEEKQ